MLVISGRRSAGYLQSALTRFNLAIEMLVISGAWTRRGNSFSIVVSISQSRCLSFQGAFHVTMTTEFRSFNLAIEMLVISGHAVPAAAHCHNRGFNLAIEMLVISGEG